MTTSKRMFALATLSLGLGACNSEAPPRDSSLAGQWEIVLKRDPVASMASAATAVGTVVFRADIPRLTGAPQLRFTPPVSVGRAFIDRSPLVSEAIGQQYSFEAAPGSDAFEEIVGKRTADSVQFVLAPSVIGGRVYLNGVLSGDEVRGTWSMPGHPGDEAVGTFRMWRVPRTAAYDSAYRRAVRARRGLPQDYASDTFLVSETR